MASSDVPLHSEITKEQFASCLSQYPAVVEAISRSKGAKDGQRTLSELDQYRYVEAVETFGLKKQKREMQLDDVKTLVEWKLRHGKFRPTLMSLVSSNPPASSAQTIQFAVKFYASSKDAGSAVRMLSELKGVGPATASLLLSVHDADNVLFFSDEAYYWLCCGGKKEAIKYTPKEYLALQTEADALRRRLGVSAVDVEKVAYVLMKQPETTKGSKADAAVEAIGPAKAATPPTSSSSKKRKTAASEGSEGKEKKAEVTAAKKDPIEEKTDLRRSKRLRK